MKIWWKLWVEKPNSNLTAQDNPLMHAELKPYDGPEPWPEWVRKIDETITRFTYRNYGWIFGMDINPSFIVPAMEPGRLISMSDYGVYYSNTDQKTMGTTLNFW